MANDLEHADDVSSMMEALWGPRTEVPAHLASQPGARPYADGRDDVDSTTVGPVVPNAEGDVHRELALIESWERESAERLAAVEHAVGSELEALRGEVADRLAASLSAVEARMVTQTGLAELRAEMRAEMVEQLRLVFDEVLKQGDARAAAVAAELSRRQEALVGKDEFAVLRSELRDELSRNMAGAQAELQGDLRTLQEQVQQLSTAVAALQRGSLGS